MTKLRLFTISFGSVLVAASALLVACSDDTDLNPTTDASTPETSTADVVTVDVVTDSGPDGAKVDGGFNFDNFPAMIGAGYCTSVARCCYGSATLDGGAPVDGGTYNQSACVAQFTKVGFEGSNVGLAAGLDAGTVSIDQAKAADCLAKIEALTCDLGATEYQAARGSCFGAYTGTLADGAPCHSSIECSASSFCNATTAGAAGTCSPLRASAAMCGDFTTDPSLADEACSFRASGVPGQHCDSTNSDFSPVTPQTDWVCTGNVANGEFCTNTNWCASGICDINDYTCKSPLELFAQAACSTYVTP